MVSRAAIDDTSRMATVLIVRDWLAGVAAGVALMALGRALRCVSDAHVTP